MYIISKVSIYEEFTRLAETRLAQRHCNYITLAYIPLTYIMLQYNLVSVPQSYISKGI